MKRTWYFRRHMLRNRRASKLIGSALRKKTRDKSKGCVSRKNAPVREARGAGGGKRPEDLETSAASAL